MAFGINKNMLWFAAIFAVFWWFIFGQFNSLMQGWFGFLGSWATVAVMMVFCLLFLVIYDKVIKKPVGI